MIFRISGVSVLLAAVLLLNPDLSAAQTDRARSGDGIYTLLQRNGIPPTSAAIAEFKSLNSRNLLPGDGLMRGIEYRLPSGATAVTWLLFGEKYARVERKGSLLDGSAFFLISGHGGADPGAVGRRAGRELHEDEYAYDVTLRVARGLLEQGAEVYVMVHDDDGIRDERWLTPDKDERNRDGSPVNRRRRVQERVAAVNRLSRTSRARHKRVIEIHVDAREQSSTQVDVHFYYQSAAGQRFSNILRDTMRERYRRAQPGRGYNGRVSYGNLYTLKYSNPVAAYVELGNIHHERDQRRVIEPGNRQAIANWMVEGIIREARSNR